MRMKALVYNAFPFTAFLSKDSEQGNRLEDSFPDVDFVFRTPETVTEADYMDAPIIIGHPSREMLSKAEELRWLHVNSAGVNGYEKIELYRNPDLIEVTRAADTFGIPMAEHTLGMMLSLSRSFRLLDAQQRDHTWKSCRAGKELFGSTVVMLGAGNLADEIVKRLKGFGVTLIAVKRNAAAVPEGYDEVYSSERLHDALAKADYVIDSLPLTDATRYMMDAEAFDAMKDECIFINIGRGATVDTQALTDALDSGKLYAAGLDVTDPEPLPAESSLWDRQNVMISPHCSALSQRENTRRTDCIIKLMQQYFLGEDLDYKVDFERGY